MNVRGWPPGLRPGRSSALRSFAALSLLLSLLLILSRPPADTASHHEEETASPSPADTAPVAGGAVQRALTGPLADMAFEEELFAAAAQQRLTEVAAAVPEPSAEPEQQQVFAPPARPPVPPDVRPPAVLGGAFAILERSCGALLFGKNEHQRLAPASLTKIITAMVVRQQADLDARVTVDVSGSQMARRGSSVMGLEPGMSLSVRDLLYGLFLPSGNDAALALARFVGAGDEGRFTAEMNALAARLHMVDSHFANPHGLDSPGLYSSAYDLALAGRAFLEDPFLAEMSTAATYQPAWDRPPLKNGNKLLSLYPGSFGIKIGYTGNARQTIVAAAEREGRQLIVSVLGSTDRYGDTIRLLDWAFANLPDGCTAH